ncbi:hypothetical protein [Selenomonas ruminantium]|uniref:PD(D/E)XK endonuclease domain-containing protein n=1 Tax=Selenomonas ruminantium TaxID=971 RepID=A0A1H3VS18_SELRU|nr:hypothetical protein [Selenomonas ruminantium]SDZ76912.1 hypothetical protein SAMN05660648_00475 [Selenomonas ruminantium]
MAWQKNLSHLGPGSYRSLSGAATENMFFGRAQQAGFPCLSKEWRDMECDGAVLSGRALYRVEIKGSIGKAFTFTHGQRAGTQVKKEVDKERAISVEDCDFAVGVDKNNGDCYIVPIDIIVIFGRKTLSKSAIRLYREKWQLFLNNEGSLTEEETKNGLLKYSLSEIEEIAERFSIEMPEDAYKPIGPKRLSFNVDDYRREILIIRIWEHLATHLIEGQDINENN